jgi:hypothetical protein
MSNRNPTDREIVTAALGVYLGKLLTGIEGIEDTEMPGKEELLVDLHRIVDRVKKMRDQVRTGDLTLGH